MKNYFLKFILLVFSFLITIIFLIVASNYYLKFFYKGEAKTDSNWRLNFLDFRPDMIYWSKSWCELDGECENHEEKILSFPIHVFKSESYLENDECKIILFLGDSFTVSPWVPFEDSYPYVFSKKYFDNEGLNCLKTYNLSAGGSNNSQELFYFKKVVDELNPDMLIWQFYWNDEIENSMNEVLFINESGQLQHRYSWESTFFISGFLNQKIPFLMGTSVGEYLMYLGVNEDFFSFLPFDFNDLEKTFSYNEKLIPKLLDSMDEVSKNKNFEWYTILAPLECEIVSGMDGDCGNAIPMQSQLRELLRNNSKYLGLDLENSSSGDELKRFKKSLDNLIFFNEIDEGNAGYRHLSEEGNIIFGEYLYNNFFIMNNKN